MMCAVVAIYTLVVASPHVNDLFVHTRLVELSI